MKGHLFVQSCGASLLEKFLGRKFEEKFGKSIFLYSNWSEEELKSKKPQVYEFFTEELENLRELLLDLSEKELREKSAELKAYLLYRRNNSLSKSVNHILITTDTFYGSNGSKVADLLKFVLENRFEDTVIYYEPIKDLRTSSLEEFHWALKELVAKLLKDLRIENYKEIGYRVVFNLTGGFKSVNSFLQTVASLYADESIYVFEKSEELLTIPKLPIRIDLDAFRKHLNFFRLLELTEKGNLNKEKFIKSIPEDVPDSLLLKVNGEVSLSPYGELLWQKAKEEMYKEVLVPPLTDRLEYSEEFKKQFNDLSPREKRALNLSLDDLNLYLLTGGQFNPSSLRVHSVRNSQYDAEFYPFEGNDSRRAYVKKDTGKFVVLKIDDHLK